MGGSPKDVRPDPAEPQEVIDGPIAWVGPITRHYGHQVADFSMRLLPTLVAAPGVPLLTATHPFYAIPTTRAAPPFWREIGAWLGAPAESFRLITRPVLVRELLVAPQAEQAFGPGPSPEHLDAMDALVERRLGRVEASGTLFVSRAGVPARLAGEAELERVFAACGVRVLRPETLPLPEQLAAFRRARTLIVTEGAVLHALQLLGRLPSDVVAINRRAGWLVADESVRPRARSLTWVAAVAGLVHGLGGDGRPAPAVGCTVIDVDRLIDGLRPSVPGLADRFDRARFHAAQEADLTEWIRTVDARLIDRPATVEHLLQTLEDAGMGRLSRVARHLIAAR
jgi:hypothetical protein